MQKLNLSSLSTEELWALHEQISANLAEKIAIEKRGLEERLARLNRHFNVGATKRRSGYLKVAERRKSRRKYPPVLPKFRNPSDPSQTWAGRGKQPRWLVAQIKAGKKLNDFVIDGKRKRAAAR